MKAALVAVVVPVADVDRAVASYGDALGFAVDHDSTTPGGERLVQLTSPGSAISITVGTVTPAAEPVRLAPGTLHGLQLAVADLRETHDELQARGVRTGGGERYEDGSLRPAAAGVELDRVAFLRFEDPAGNGRVVQRLGAA